METDTRPGGQLVFELADASTSALILHQARASDTPHVARHPMTVTRPSSRGSSGAALLNAKLRSLEASKELTTEISVITALPSTSRSVLGGVKSAALRVASQLHPQGDTHNDDTLAQRTVNILTSLPFLAIGAHMMGRMHSAEGKQFAGSMLAVGTAATLYHATSGKLRKACRKLDYWTISATSTLMSNALFPQNRWRRHAMLASLAVTPFRPLTVTAAHVLAMQSDFVRQAATHKALLPAFKRHIATAMAGTAAFALEDLAAESGVCDQVHAIWHLLAAAGVATTGSLVEHKEWLRAQEALGGPFEKTASLRSRHDSVSSLKSLGSCSLEPAPLKFSTFK